MSIEGKMNLRAPALTRRSKKFKPCEAVVFDPPKWRVEDYPQHPLARNELVYYLGEIPNVPGHCIVVKYSGQVVPMIHPGDLRKATEEEL